MDVINDPSVTLVTPTPINMTRPSSPKALGDLKDLENLEEEQSSLKRIWIACNRPFYGIINDIHARIPFYISDWKDAYDYRVIPATAMIFFAK